MHYFHFLEVTIIYKTTDFPGKPVAFDYNDELCVRRCKNELA